MVSTFTSLHKAAPSTHSGTFGPVECPVLHVPTHGIMEYLESGISPSARFAHLVAHVEEQHLTSPLLSKGFLRVLRIEPT